VTFSIFVSQHIFATQPVLLYAPCLAMPVMARRLRKEVVNIACTEKVNEAEVSTAKSDQTTLGHMFNHGELINDN
jgi:hypothetical protein